MKRLGGIVNIKVCHWLRQKCFSKTGALDVSALPSSACDSLCLTEKHGQSQWHTDQLSQPVSYLAVSN